MLFKVKMASSRKSKKKLTIGVDELILLIEQHEHEIYDLPWYDYFYHSAYSDPNYIVNLNTYINALLNHNTDINSVTNSYPEVDISPWQEIDDDPYHTITFLMWRSCNVEVDVFKTIIEKFNMDGTKIFNNYVTFDELCIVFSSLTINEIESLSMYYDVDTLKGLIKMHGICEETYFLLDRLSEKMLQEEDQSLIDNIVYSLYLMYMSLSTLSNRGYNKSLQITKIHDEIVDMIQYLHRKTIRVTKELVLRLRMAFNTRKMLTNELSSTLSLLCL